MQTFSLQAAKQPAHCSNSPKQDILVPSIEQMQAAADVGLTAAHVYPYLHADVVESFMVDQSSNLSCT